MVLLVDNWRGGSKPPRQLRLQLFSWPFALEAPERRCGVRSLFVSPGGGRNGFVVKISNFNILSL
jgi:hypothetical protein